jgi:DNA-binding beta-propeller fold protein YncE
MPSAIVASASGTRVYVSYLTDAPTGGLAVIDVATHAVRTVSFGQVAAGLDAAAAEGRAFVADVSEIAVVELAGPSLATTFSDGTAFPFDVAIDHTTGRLYVTNFDGFVSVHDGTTFAPIASIPADFEAGRSVPKKVRRLLKHARRALTLADNAAKKATRGKQPKLTVACAAAIESAAENARGDLGP